MITVEAIQSTLSNLCARMLCTDITPQTSPGNICVPQSGETGPTQKSGMPNELRITMFE
jgi:hypothetical protein